jgi:hypothetical protein
VPRLQASTDNASLVQGKGGGLHTQRKPRDKMTQQRELIQFDDELRKYCEQMDGELFDRENRLAMLENQKHNPAPNSIFGAIFQELKNKAKHEKHKKIA